MICRWPRHSAADAVPGTNRPYREPCRAVLYLARHRQFPFFASPSGIWYRAEGTVEPSPKFLGRHVGKRVIVADDKQGKRAGEQGRCTDRPAPPPFLEQRRGSPDRSGVTDELRRPVLLRQSKLPRETRCRSGSPVGCLRQKHCHSTDRLRRCIDSTRPHNGTSAGRLQRTFRDSFVASGLALGRLQETSSLGMLVHEEWHKRASSRPENPKPDGGLIDKNPQLVTGKLFVCHLTPTGAV